MATRPGYVNSRQEQYKLDQQLMRELRNDKNYETKWFTVGEIGLGDVAVRKADLTPVDLNLGTSDFTAYR